MLPTYLGIKSKKLARKKCFTKMAYKSTLFLSKQSKPLNNYLSPCEYIKRVFLIPNKIEDNRDSLKANQNGCKKVT